jgi:hypothetical protein
MPSKVRNRYFNRMSIEIPANLADLLSEIWTDCPNLGLGLRWLCSSHCVEAEQGKAIFHIWRMVFIVGSQLALSEMLVGPFFGSDTRTIVVSLLGDC